MKITGDWIDHPGTQSLCVALEMAGFQALFVGGCVRNALLSVPVSDIDIATDAEPKMVSDIAENAGFRVVPTGIDHGTVTVIAQGRAHEVTTFRKDVQTDGRHAVVAYSSSLADDASRRDFTMNALYADRSGTVLDPLGGLGDLRARHVRFVGEAEARIREDYLRILRFFRFHAHYGDPTAGIDAEGLAACAAHTEGLEALSRERVGSEMRKLLSAKDPAPAIGSMAMSGVLTTVLPGADPKALAVLVHMEEQIPPRWLRRLAVMGGLDPTDRLRMTRQESTHLGWIREEIGSLSTPAALAFCGDATLAEDVCLARSALFETALPPNWQADIQRGAAAQFPVTAADFMPALQGQALGAHLNTLKQRWLKSDLRLTRNQLIG